MLAPSATYYFAEVIRGAHEAAARAGARLILRISDYRPEEDHARTEGLLAAGAEGLLVAPGWRRPGDPAAYGDWIASLPGAPCCWSAGRRPGRRWTGPTGSARTTGTGCCWRCATWGNWGTGRRC